MIDPVCSRCVTVAVLQVLCFSCCNHTPILSLTYVIMVTFTFPFLDSRNISFPWEPMTSSEKFQWFVLWFFFRAKIYCWGLLPLSNLSAWISGIQISFSNTLYGKWSKPSIGLPIKPEREICWIEMKIFNLPSLDFYTFSKEF